MKKVLFIAVLGVISLASCKKDRTCTCTTTSTQAGYVTKVVVTDYEKSKKKSAKYACAISSDPEGKNLIWTKTDHTDAVAGPPALPAYTTTETCVLK